MEYAVTTGTRAHYVNMASKTTFYHLVLIHNPQRCRIGGYIENRPLLYMLMKMLSGNKHISAKKNIQCTIYVILDMEV